MGFCRKFFFSYGNVEKVTNLQKAKGHFPYIEGVTCRDQTDVWHNTWQSTTKKLSIFAWQKSRQNRNNRDKIAKIAMICRDFVTIVAILSRFSSHKNWQLFCCALSRVVPNVCLVTTRDTFGVGKVLFCFLQISYFPHISISKKKFTTKTHGEILRIRVFSYD